MFVVEKFQRFEKTKIFVNLKKVTKFLTEMFPMVWPLTWFRAKTIGGILNLKSSQCFILGTEPLGSFEVPELVLEVFQSLKTLAQHSDW